MSQYLHIFIRQNNQFAPIYCASRSNCMYQALQNIAPYEKISQLTISKISEAIAEVEITLEMYDSQIKTTRELMKLIEASSDTLEEKCRVLGDMLIDINSYEEEKDEHKIAKIYLEFLKTIAISMSDSIDYDEAAKDLGLYAGIECGEHVTVDDIQ